MLGVYADLVGTAGFDPHLAVRMPTPAFQNLEVTDRLLADRVHLYVALAALAQAHVQRRVHRHGAVRHAPHQQGQVALADARAVVFTQQRLQFAQRRALLGHHQQARGVPVQPVHQFQRLARAQRAQRLDRAEADPAAPVTGDPRRLVQGQQPVVLKDDGRLQALHERLWRCRFVSFLGETHRRHPDFIPRFQLALGLGAAAVHPHLAAAHQLVYQAARSPFQLAQQEVVQALPGAVGRNCDHAHAGLGVSGLWGRLGDGHWPFILLHSAGEIRD